MIYIYDGDDGNDDNGNDDNGENDTESLLMIYNQKANQSSSKTWKKTCKRLVLT